MSPEFSFPDWAIPPEPPPSPPRDVDPHRIGDLVNGFIAAKQDTLFDATDAFYRQSGADAVAAAPAITQRLTGLRDATLEQAADDGKHQALQTQLDAQLSDALDGIDRHVAQHRDVRNSEILAERQRLIERAATLEHNNEEKLAGLAEANAGTAGELARLNALPEEAAMQAARSAVWRSAIGERIATGQNAEALTLFHRVNDQLNPADRRVLDVPIQAARTDATADAWIAREKDKPGEPLAARAQVDPDLSPAEKAAMMAKLEAEASARESSRVATVQGLDDKLETTAHALATKPASYRRGTLAVLADAYDQAGEAARAAPIRRLAEREPFLLSFARSSAEAQQRQIDSRPDGDDRAAAKAIQDRQAEAFAKDPFAAGTALYPDVGPPKPIDDIEGRVAQARIIAAYRSIPVVPFNAAELTKMRQQYANGTPQEREAVLTLVNSLPDDVKPPVEGPPSGGPYTFSIGAAPSMTANEKAASNGRVAPATEPSPDSKEYRTADADARRLETSEQIATDRMISQWANLARPGDEVPSELAERLDPEQRQATEALVSKAKDVETDPTVFREILSGLKSRNPGEARKWARAPLYRYRAQLSQQDFANLVELQRDLDEDGVSQSEIAAIRKNLQATDTGDLAPLYRALAPASGTTYSTLLPLAKDANGIRFAMPESVRSFVKGTLDLLAGTKSGELTPDAVNSFTTITGGAGRIFGPRGSAATFAAGGKRPAEAAAKKPLPEEQLARLRAQFEKNKIAGRDHERKIGEWLAKRPDLDFAPQITIKPEGGPPVKLDYLARNRTTGEIEFIEGKSSDTARLTPRQRVSHPKIETSPSVIVGGKPKFEGGQTLPPGKVQVMRPNDVD